MQIYNFDRNKQFLEELCKIRSLNLTEELIENVRKILKDIRENGDDSVIYYNKLFDNVNLKKENLKVSESEIKEAFEKVNKEFIDSVKCAIANINKFHKAQLPHEISVKFDENVILKQIFRPIESVGIYVPGGKAVLISSLIMGAVPAKIARVPRIVVCSPPRKNGKLSPELLVTANLLGIEEIYKIGGVQAIGALAFGTEILTKVNKIVGPGNIYVTIAKQLVSNTVAIDLPAGPSEIGVILDSTANIKFILYDLLAQAEHGPNAFIAVTSNDMSMLNQIKNQLINILSSNTLPEYMEQNIKNIYLIKCKEMDQCIEIMNQIAPEHLEIVVKNVEEILKKTKNAGAIFIGNYSPVAAGDYAIGSNHILPTLGFAKSFSGLNTHSFLKAIDVVYCNKKGLQNLAPTIINLAEFEGLKFHKESIEIRVKKG